MIKKIKVLHILPSLTKAGAETVVFNLLNNLDQNKFELSLLLFKDTNEGLDWENTLKQKNIFITRLKKNCLFDFYNFLQICKKIKKFNPDIVHTHLGADIYGRLAAKLLGIKIIVSTEHNLNVSERYIAKKFKIWTSPWTKKIFAVSQAVLADALSRYRLTSDKLTVIYNGIDWESFHKLSTSLKNKKDFFTIGTLSRLSAQKGISILIKAVSLSKHTNFVLNIAGEGILKNDLEKEVKKLKLEKRVNLLGQVSAQNFLSNIDIFIFPSLWEGLGLSLLEAAAMSKVIIASNTDGIKEVINSENGFLFITGDELDLAHKLDYVIDNFYEPVVQQKTILLTELIKNKFSLKQMVLSYDNWYHELLND